jgi:hypothetical protein
MTTQPEQAVGSETPAPSEDPFEAIAEDTFGADEEEEPAEAPEAEAEDDIEDEEEADDLPPIDAPVSWDADAKAKFAKLPRDVQEYVQKREVTASGSFKPSPRRPQEPARKPRAGCIPAACRLRTGSLSAPPAIRPAVRGPLNRIPLCSRPTRNLRLSGTAV